MTADILKAAMGTWAAKNLPLRILAEQTAGLINCTTEDLAIIVSAGKLRALGKPKPNAVKYFSAIEVIALGSDPDWLDDITKTIRQHWQRKNARRHGSKVENMVADHSGCRSVSGGNNGAS